MSDTLETQLRELADAVRVDVPTGLEAAVMARVTEQASRPHRLSRWFVGLFLGLLGAGAVASPVGASILDWFGFHGVAVVEGQPPVTEEPTVPAEPTGMTLGEVAELAGFTPLVPAELGKPDGVAVSADRRVVSLSWGTGGDTVRLDEFRGDIDPLFWKTVESSSIVTIATGDALWLPTAHHVEVVADDGTTQRLPSRLAAPTLVWPQGELTLRLEGDQTLDRAVTIADSTG